MTKPEYDLGRQQWKVVHGNATWWFSSYENAVAWYNDNKDRF